MSEPKRDSLLDSIIHSPRFWAAVVSLLQVLAAIVQGQLIENTETTKLKVEQTKQEVEQTKQNVEQLIELVKPPH